MERRDLPVEYGPCDELAAALALNEIPAGVDEDDAPAEGLLGQAMPLDGIATSAAKTSAIARGKIRLNDRGFDLCANSFTSLPFAAIHRIAALAEEFEQTK